MFESGKKEKVQEFFQIAEEKYKALMDQSDNIESYGLNQIRLERSFKTHDTAVIVKLFYYFQNHNTIIFSRESILLIIKILDYLHENNHKKIFHDFLRDIVSYYHVKLDQNQFSSVGISLETQILSAFFQSNKELPRFQCC